VTRNPSPPSLNLQHQFEYPRFPVGKGLGEFGAFAVFVGVEPIEVPGAEIEFLVAGNERVFEFAGFHLIGTVIQYPDLGGEFFAGGPSEFADSGAGLNRTAGLLYRIVSGLGDIGIFNCIQAAEKVLYRIISGLRDIGIADESIG
jgi:hypothetical protein